MPIDWGDLSSADPKLAWTIISTEVGEQMFDEDMYVVPRLEEAPYFDLMVCFSKPGNTFFKSIKNLYKEEYTFYLQGHILDLICKDETTSAEQKKLLDACKPVNADVDSEIFSHEWSNNKGKEIKVQLRGLSKKVITLSGLNKGDIVFDTEEALNLNGKRRLYVITEVVYASNTTIKVSVEGKEKKNEIKTKIPIAFSYTKFPISSSGIMKAAVDTKIKKTAKFAPADYA